MRNRILDAQKLPTLANAEAELRDIERDLKSVKWKDVPGADEMLGFARYRIAFTLHQRAAMQLQLNRWSEAQRQLSAAAKKYDEVLVTPDSVTTGEGSSLHALALLQIVAIEVSQYAATAQILRDNPRSRPTYDAMKKHREAAVKTLDKLRRQFPDATFPDGEKVVDRAEEEARRLGQ